MVWPGQAAPSFVRLAGHPLRWRLLAELAASDCGSASWSALVGEPQNLVSYHLRLLRDGGLVTAPRSSFDARDSYYHLDLDRCAHALAGAGAALHPALRCAARHRVPGRADRGPRSPCCSCAPATAPARRSPKPCCATAPAATSR